MKRVLPVAILFAGLLAITVVKEVSRARVDEGGADTDDYVPFAVEKFTVNDVEKIEVTGPAGAEPAFVVERDGARWLMTKPFRAPAHVNAVEDLCKALASGDAEMRTDDAGALRDVDLIPERATQVRLTGAGGKPLTHVAIGRSTGAKGAFVRFMGGTNDVRAFETATDVRGLLGLGRTAVGDADPEQPKPAQFRDRDFPTLKLDNPKRVEVVAPGRRVVLERTSGPADKPEGWKVVAGGPGLPVNAGGVQQMLQRLGPDFHAKDLADPADLAKLGLADPRWSVSVTLDDGTVKRTFGACDPKRDVYYARLDAKQDPDVVYEATSWEWQRLFPPGSGLFTFENADFPDDQLTRMVVDRNVGGVAERLEIVRDGTKPTDDWRVVEPDWPLAPKQTSLRSLVSVLRNVRPIDWIDGTDLGPEEITIRAGRSGVADGELPTVRVGGQSPAGKDRVATVPNAPGRVLVLADSTVDRIAVPAASLFEAKVLHGWTEADVTAVRVERRVGETWAPSFSIERRAAGFELVVGADSTPAASAATTKWITALLGLETRDPAAADSPADEARLTLERKAGAPVTLIVSQPKDGRRTLTLGSYRFPSDTADLLPAADALK
ncbi:MAG: DUF4340 domain-containing protein [Planctomycetes bacterium]|nr:DUF4340 domain-containing protein [Planctomycetota bacterium]